MARGWSATARLSKTKRQQNTDDALVQAGCAPEPGACLCCGSLKQDEGPAGAITILPPYTRDMSCDPPISDAIRATVDATVDGLADALRALSLDIWGAHTLIGARPSR